jgi:hypothetical protein
MQNRDGGFGAFDVDNKALFLNKITFSDMDALCDPLLGLCHRKSVGSLRNTPSLPSQRKNTGQLASMDKSGFYSSY